MNLTGTSTNMKTLLGPMRLPFLLLTPVCVALGLAVTYWRVGQISHFGSALVLIGALAAHIGVNLFNEYFDFRCGLDSRTRRTPFSGGSGTLPSRPSAAPAVLSMALIASLISVSIGAYLVHVRGTALLPLGILGIVLVLTYTPWLTRLAWLCLIAPGLGFGPCMVLGTYVALTGHYSASAAAASLIPFFLVNNLLLLNQFPDVEADRSVGRRNIPILLGRRVGGIVYGAFFVLAYLALGVSILLQMLPWSSALGLTPLILGIPIFYAIGKYSEEPVALIPYLGLNVLVCLATPILMAWGIFSGG